MSRSSSSATACAQTMQTLLGQAEEHNGIARDNQSPLQENGYVI
jgi:hypothetical protein